MDWNQKKGKAYDKSEKEEDIYTFDAHYGQRVYTIRANEVDVDLTIFDYTINLMFWNLCTAVDHPIEDVHLVFFENVTKRFIKEYIDNVFIDRYRKKIPFIMLNQTIDAVIGKFRDLRFMQMYLGNTLNLEDTIDLMNQYPDFADTTVIVNAFWSIAPKYNIRGDVALCQSIVETGWFKFTGGTAVTPDQHNYCGMGVTSLGVKGNSFKTVENGVEAQIQHLYAYATKTTIPTGRTLYDPRFKYVTRGSATKWIDLEGKWCAKTGTYAKSIFEIYDQMSK